MNRSTVVMLVVFALLVLVWALSGQKRDVEREVPPLVVNGFLKKEISLQDIKIYNRDEESPYTRYAIDKEGPTGPESYVVELDPTTANEKKAADKVWWVSRTFEGGKKTMKVRAENYRLRMYNQLLARSFRSSYAFKTTGRDLNEYGLDPAHAIRVVATSPDQTVKFVIGSKHDMEDGGSSTWVMNPDVEGVIYQISGHDLRTNFDAPWKDIRDRKILRINPGRIHRVEVNNPRSPGRGVVVLERPKLTAAQLVKIASAKKWDEVRKAEADWQITSPSGFKADGQEIGSWLESLERMSATDYVDLKDGKLPEKTGLDDKKQAVSVKLYDGDKVVEIIIGLRNPKGVEQDIFVQVVGHTTEIYGVAGWMGDQIVMDRDKLRDRRLLSGLKAAEASAVEIASGAERFTATRTATGWTSPTSLDPKNLIDFLGDLDGIRVEWQSAKSREESGLVPPKTRLTLTWTGDGKQPAVTRTLLVAAKKGEDGFAAFLTGDVFKVPSWNAGRLHRRPRDFADKHVLQAPLSAIASVTIPTDKAGVTVAILRDGAGWKASNGVQIKAALVDSWLKSLAEATYHEEVDDKPADVGLEPPVYALSVKTTDGRVLGFRVSTKLLENNPYGAMLVNGKYTRIFSISTMMVPMLQKRLDDLTGKKAAPSRQPPMGRPGAAGMPPMGPGGPPPMGPGGPPPMGPGRPLPMGPGNPPPMGTRPASPPHPAAASPAPPPAPRPVAQPGTTPK